MSAALSTAEGIAGWWTKETSGESEGGGTIHVRFRTKTGDLKGEMKFELLELGTERAGGLALRLGSRGVDRHGRGQLLETGTGQPAPDDRKIDDWN